MGAGAVGGGLPTGAVRAGKKDCGPAQRAGVLQCSARTMPIPCTMPCPPTLAPQMAADVQQLGVPASAIPPLPPNATEAEVRAARDLLSGMLASFLSAGL